MPSDVDDTDQVGMDEEDDGDDDVFQVKPAPTGYVYTGLDVRGLCEDGGDPDWTEDKEYTDDVCSSFSQEDIIQMYGRVYGRPPPLNSVDAVYIAEELESDTQVASNHASGMHDPIFCSPLYILVTDILKSAEKGEYEDAFLQVEGLLLALSGEAENGMDRWTYTDSHTGDVCCDLAGLMVVAVAHVCFAKVSATLPDPDTPEGQCLDTVLSRLSSIHSPGDETEMHEKFFPKLEALAKKRAKTAKVLILCGPDEEEDNDDVSLTCSLKDLSDTWGTFTAQHKEVLE